MPNVSPHTPGIYFPSKYGTANRKDYAGDGSRENPFQFLFHSGDTGVNYNAATLTLRMFTDQSLVAVRLKKVIISLSGSAASAMATICRAGVTLTTATGASSAMDTFICEPVLFTSHSTGAYYGDTHTWDFGPDGIVLLRDDTKAWDGNWDGIFYPCFAGYAATDDAVVIVEGEWWYL